VTDNSLNRTGDEALEAAGCAGIRLHLEACDGQSPAARLVDLWSLETLSGRMCNHVEVRKSMENMHIEARNLRKT
jgi:hypothetical protein